ncbi:type III PLP-dependent enzyme [uncultured Jatrophihabitans sp.]|uniref:type III PLP-dependent enzyme n=1 Tax=uncultured Jatrophihabitans sp. TaxID=1610747 RepID=UPI0035C9B6C8
MPKTPFFTIKRSALHDGLRAFREAIPGVEVYFAVKANPEPVVLSTLAAAGACFEVASVYEMNVLDGLGITTAHMAYGTAVKPSAHIRDAHSAGIRVMSADSIAEVDKIADLAPNASVFIRVRVDDSRSTFAFGEKFGAEVADAYALASYVRSRGLQCRGLSFHVGSQSVRPSAWAAAIDLVRPIYDKFEAEGHPLPWLNIGGGFPCQYEGPAVPTIEEIGAEITRALDELRPVRLLAEPGRFLAAPAATLTASVVGRSERGGSHWLFLDAGCYNGLFEAMSYQGRTQYPVASLDPASSNQTLLFNVAGPTGDSADVIARDVRLPANIQEGGRLLFSKVGAYTMSLSVPFNGFPRPELVVE